MSSLFTSLINSANTLQVFQRALTVVQNNVSNSETPGYAKLRQTLNALPFDPAGGVAGGVMAGQVMSARDEYAEQAVRSQQQLYGQADQTSSDLARIEPFFNVTGDQGIPGALNQFFQAVSGWSVTPNDTVARQTVLDRAGALVQTIHQTAGGLSDASNSVAQQISSTASQINKLASQMRDLNVARSRSLDNTTDPSIDAQMHTTLEQLSELVDVQVLPQENGTLTLLIGGQIPLVVGAQQYQLQVDASDPAQTKVTSPQSGAADLVDSSITGGRLGSLLQTKNQTLPSFMGDLNTLAKVTADQINGVLDQGVDSTGQPGNPLFTYDSPDGSDAATTLAATGISVDQLAGALPDAPGGNTNALNLTALANQPISDLSGFTLTGFYAQLASNVGQQSSDATETAQSQKQSLIQAQSLRSQVSGVSLDEEAANLIEFQRAYQATSKMITVLNDLTQTTMDMLR